MTDFKLTRVAEDSDLDVNVPDASPNSGRCALPWCVPELLDDDPERFGFKRSGPRKKSDIYEDDDYGAVMSSKAEFEHGIR